MKRARPILIMVVLPAIVSLAVTLFVLILWDSQQAPGQRVIILPTHSGTAMVEGRPSQVAASDGGQPIFGGGEETEVAAPPVSGDCQNPQHAVAAGETLGVIATQYGVTVDDLIALNQSIDSTFNPDLLSIGQTLAIPVCGVPTTTPVPTAVDTLVPTRDIPTPVSTSTEPAPGTISVRITRVLNIGDITREAVEILNEGSPVDLNGWTLSDGFINEFEFPSFRLFTGGGVTVYSGVGQDTPINLYWGLTIPLWEIGDTVYLSNADGVTVFEFEITKQ